MPQDDLDHIPSIVPTRDGPPERREGRGGKQPERRRGQGSPPSGGGGVLTRVFIILSLGVAAVACAWAWQLQNRLEQADDQLLDYANRIGDLEARLSDTDEGMTQNAAVQAAKIRELDSEVRKLWDNVWKSAKERLDQLEAQSAAQAKSIGGLEGSVKNMQGTLDSAAGDIARLKSVAGDMSRLMASAKANQAEVERLADTLNRIDLELAKLAKRVAGNEEWVGSINAFRRQVHASLTELQSAVRNLQAPPP